MTYIDLDKPGRYSQCHEFKQTGRVIVSIEYSLIISSDVPARTEGNDET